MVVSIEKFGIQAMIAEFGNEEKEDYHDLHLALSRLEADDLELLELRFFENRPFKEIAEILAITENNAKVRTYRTLDKLKKLL
jgi:RNA polymerase sigma-70 factor (ECF subfamily)